LQRLQRDFSSLEKEYNDAKEKGIPTKNNWDETGQGMKPDWHVPYSSQRLFQDDTDKKNGCFKQIRYYGKDGKAELDIDFSHDGPYALPHKHPWSNGKRYGHGDLNSIVFPAGGDTSSGSRHRNRFIRSSNPARSSGNADSPPSTEPSVTAITYR
jgi:hypothetical protein